MSSRTCSRLHKLLLCGTEYLVGSIGTTGHGLEMWSTDIPCLFRKLRSQGFKILLMSLSKYIIAEKSVSQFEMISKASSQDIRDLSNPKRRSCESNPGNLRSFGPMEVPRSKSGAIACETFLHIDAPSQCEIISPHFQPPQRFSYYDCLPFCSTHPYMSGAHH